MQQMLQALDSMFLTSYTYLIDLFVQDCIFDACIFNDPFQAISDAFAAYDVECRKIPGVKIGNWRNLTSTGIIIRTI